LGVAVAAPVLAGCGGGAFTASTASAGGQRIAVFDVDGGCQPSAIQARSGPVALVVTNQGAGDRAGVDVLSHGRVVAAVTALRAGRSATVKLTLAAGIYLVACHGARKGVAATGAVLTVLANPSDQAPDLVQAANAYRVILLDDADQLVTAVTEMDHALADGAVAEAQQRYVVARQFYGLLQPLAAAFGSVDSALDVLPQGVPVDRIDGFHRIEYGLWVTGSTAGLLPVADGLTADVTELRAAVPALAIDPGTMADGVDQLLGRDARNVVTGQEEPFSHVDLVDLQADLEGSQAAVDTLRRALGDRTETLATTIDQRFAQVQSVLNPLRTASGFVPTTQITATQAAALTGALDALGQPVSQVAAALARPPLR